MDFSWSREEDEFRQEIRDFLKAELPQGWNDTLVLDKESEEYIELAKDLRKGSAPRAGWRHIGRKSTGPGLVLLAVLHHE